MRHTDNTGHHSSTLHMMGDLFYTFFKIGAFTFGGGYAMIPLIQREVVDNKGWIESADVLDILAIAESTPGPLAINSATFVGYKMGGVLGSIAATLGVSLPSYLIICLISLVLEQFMANQWVSWAFMGIRSGVLVLMLNAILKLGKACPKDVFSFAVMGAAFLIATFTGFDIMYLLLGAAVLGIAFQMLRVRKAGEPE